MLASIATKKIVIDPTSATAVIEIKVAVIGMEVSSVD